MKIIWRKVNNFEENLNNFEKKREFGNEKIAKELMTDENLEI